MSFSRPIQWYQSHADLIWPDGTFKSYTQQCSSSAADNKGNNQRKVLFPAGNVLTKDYRREVMFQATN